MELNKERKALMVRYDAVREASVAMCKPLQVSDYWRQVREHASPAGWNLIHTSWMFSNILHKHGGIKTEQDAEYGAFANSYYSKLGKRISQAERGSREWLSVEQIYAYRIDIDTRIAEFASTIPEERWMEFSADLTLGMQHEQQHQELFYVEEKERRFLKPRWYKGMSYRDSMRSQIRSFLMPLEMPRARNVFDFTVDMKSIVIPIGNVEGGFVWDNEYGVHDRCLEPFNISNRLVNCGEYLHFMQDGGYKRESLWLANGWKTATAGKWSAPGYWKKRDGAWQVYTLDGYKPLDMHEPVCHVSFYEADAFARWKGMRLPTEFEWEYAARTCAEIDMAHGFLGNNSLHPYSAIDGHVLYQMYGQVWQWTTSHYEAYPHFQPYEGFLSEYNGKFMDISRVLRGGSCMNEQSHLRPSYRNFWSPDTRWQMTGIRLAKYL